MSCFSSCQSNQSPPFTWVFYLNCLFKGALSSFYHLKRFSQWLDFWRFKMYTEIRWRPVILYQRARKSCFTQHKGGTPSWWMAFWNLNTILLQKLYYFGNFLVVNTSAKGHIEHSYNGIEKLKHLVWCNASFSIKYKTVLVCKDW